MNVTARKPAARQVAILLYHRVADLACDPQLLAVSPEQFRKHLEVIRKIATPISLSTLVRGLPTGDFPEPCVVVTFDDGYCDNQTIAAPLLAEASVPATVFVTARADANEREFWWDALERVFLQTERLPEALHLRIDGAERKWNLNGNSIWSKQDLERQRGWNVLHNEPATLRHELYLELCRLIKPLPATTRNSILDELNHWAGIRGFRETHRTMSESQLKSLVSHDLIEVGGHTLTHPELSALDAASQRDEISTCRRRLEEITGKPVRHFSYPFGTRRDYSKKTVEFVRDAGYTSACANFPGAIGPDEPIFELPRNLVRNWNAELFESHLRTWLDV